MENIEHLRYPTGKFNRQESYSADENINHIRIISDFPDLFKAVAHSLNDEKLNSPYRPGGWTAKQVIHHVADSHMNAYIRFKLALTEKTPTIKPYLEALWAELPEAKNADINLSLNLIEALHKRWVLMLQNIHTDEWQNTFFHPEHNREMRLDVCLALYAWHCNHHLGHLKIIARL